MKNKVNQTVKGIFFEKFITMKDQSWKVKGRRSNIRQGINKGKMKIEPRKYH